MHISPIRPTEYTQWKTIWSAFIAHMSTTLPESQYRASWRKMFLTQPPITTVVYADNKTKNYVASGLRWGDIDMTQHYNHAFLRMPLSDEFIARIEAQSVDQGRL